MGPIAAIAASACGRVGFDAIATDGASCDAVAQIDWASTPLPQDASAQLAPARSYTVTATTVSDAVTQLVWQRGQAPTALAWTDAVAYCATLVLDGCAAWRLPQRIELATLVDHDGAAMPTIDTGAFPNTPFDSEWWSATPAVSGGNAWVVNFDNGNSFTDTLPTANYVRCVRGGTVAQPPPARYAIAAATVTDLATGLVWERIVDATARTHDQARTYCATLAIDTHVWRLPTIIELQSLHDTTRSSPVVDLATFPGTAGDAYWSSTQFNTSGVAMIMSFLDGTVNNAPPTAMHRTRCVR